MDAQETMPYDAQGEDEKGNETELDEGCEDPEEELDYEEDFEIELHEMPTEPTGKDGKDQVTSKEEDQDGGIPPGQITPDVVEPALASEEEKETAGQNTKGTHKAWLLLFMFILAWMLPR